MIQVFDFEIEPKCSMDEIEEQFNEKGYENHAISGYIHHSNMEFKKEGFADIRVVGNYCGSKVECVFQEGYGKYCVKHISLWRRHFWSFKP